MQFLRCARKAAVLGGGHEDTQLADRDVEHGIDNKYLISNVNISDFLLTCDSINVAPLIQTNRGAANGENNSGDEGCCSAAL